MAFTIAKQDTRKSVQLVLTVPASLADDLTAWGKALDSEQKYVAIQILAQACEQNRKDFEHFKDTTSSKDSSKTSTKKSQKTSNAVEISAA